MFEALVDIISVITTITYYAFYYSFKLGQGLVCAFRFVSTNVLSVLINLTQILGIVFESFIIFYQDILQGLQQLLEVQQQLWEMLCSSSSNLILIANNVTLKINYTCYQIYSLCENSVISIYMLLITTCKFIKHLIVLFGAGVWFAVTFIPLSLSNLLHLFIHLIKSGLINSFNGSIIFIKYLKDCLKSIYIFVTDVPVESVIGLIVALCLIYILTQFYVTLYQSTRQIYINFFNNLGRHSLTQQRNVRTINRVSRNERMLNNTRNERTLNRRPTVYGRPQIGRSYESETSLVDAKNNITDEKYCVICQERSKCILVLPCRHVCMCMECTARLQLYNNTCPICRNDIESTMKIFV